MNKLLFIGLVFLASSLSTYAQLYKQPFAPVEERVQDLLHRMTLEEKVGQLRCPLGWPMYEKNGKNKVTYSAEYVKMMKEAPIGSFWAVLRADPWTQKTLETGLNPALAAKALNALQKYAVEKTRLGIPVFFAEECPHGHMAIGTTVFPTGIGQASTWNKTLLYRMGNAIAQEARSQGAHFGYGPVLDIAREPRWSRVEETLGEDPCLAGTLGAAIVKGMQGTNPADDMHLYATLKHLAAYGVPRGGHNGNPADMGARALLSEYLPGFQQAVEEGKAASVMTSYNSIDGVPCTSNPFLLKDLLRKTWHFQGAVFSDLGSINGNVGMRVAKDLKEAAVQSIQAGTDIDLGAKAYATLVASVKEGRLKENVVDSAVANVLRLKFKMGLFEHPYVSPAQASKLVHSAEHVALARQVAKESVVLLKNDEVLPLRKNLQKVAVIGPNADVAYNYLGDYTAPQPEGKVITLLDAVKKKLPAAEIIYAKGCAIRDTTQSDISAAVEAARKAEVVIVAVGGSSARDFKTKYIQTGAATVSDNTVSDMDCGEGYDRSTLRLLGDQEKLIQAVAATGKPMVVVYIEGRPLLMNLAAQKANALLTAWYPGEQGGNGIADVLFGDYNPSGRLPVSVPRSEGQLPVYYSQGTQRDYMDGRADPLYPFGFGLSYTTFSYDRLCCQSVAEGDTLQLVSCMVTNTGHRDGEEVVQLYLTDETASVALPPLRLKGFVKVFLKAGESKEVVFPLTRKDLSIYDKDMRFTLEPGWFKVRVGSSSQDLPLNGRFEITK